jgi:metal-sulfur cluster biosynthetic enzyme
MTAIPYPSVDDVRLALGTVYDPEFGLSLPDLGLVESVQVDGRTVRVELTLTSMYCPAGQVILEGARAAVAKVPGVETVEVELVWEPAWTPERMSASAREQLGWRGGREEA